MTTMVSMSKIVIIGVTGSLGFDLAISSLCASHPTFGLVRDSAFSYPIKSEKFQILPDSGVTLLEGSLQDERSLLEAIKLVYVVICAIPSNKVHNQKLLVRAIKIANFVKVSNHFQEKRPPYMGMALLKISNHVAIKIALELKKLLIDNSLLDVSQSDLEANLFKVSSSESTSCYSCLWYCFSTCTKAKLAKCIAGLAGDLRKAIKDGKPIIIEGLHLDPSIYLMADENKSPMPPKKDDQKQSGKKTFADWLNKISSLLESKWPNLIIRPYWMSGYAFIQIMRNTKSRFSIVLVSLGES